MDLITIILFAIGLAMDCFAVSVAKGLSAKKSSSFFHEPWPWLMALLFGLFQGGMPLIGYFGGTFFRAFFDTYAGWIALVLLGIIGGKMVWEGCTEKDEEEPTDCGWSMWNLLVLSVATSIDALATGVIFIPVPESLWLGVGVIALGSFLFSLAGYLIGKYVGQRFHLNVEVIGGLILIAIGLKICFVG